MRKLLAVLALSVFISPITHAQDSINKTKPVVKAPVTKPATTTTKPVTTARPYGQATPNQVKPPATTPTTTTQQPVTQPVQPAAYDTAANDKSLKGQYQYVLTKVYHYQQPMIAALWKNVNDTLNTERKKLKAANSQLSLQGKSMDSVRNDLNAKSQSLNETEARQDSISLLGMYLPKTTYNLVMWGLVVALAVVLLVVILRTGGNAREAKYRTKLYDELSEEFQTYKVKANEKEKKLARELQTERNKVDELMGRG